MITIPAALEKATKSGNLTGLKPFALLYRNKWVLDDESESESGASDAGHFELDTENPIDISAMIVKPNTLSMTLDVNEIAQYNANNVTLTLSDLHNKFIEGVPGSYFPDGYQLYGSKVVLYYGLNSPITPYTSQVDYSVVGSPTISTEGKASGFTTSNYITVPAFSPSSNTWQIVTKFKLANTNTNQIIFSNNYQPNRQVQLSVESSKLKIYLSTNGTSDNLANGVFGTATISEDTDYWVKFEFTGSAYIVSYSTDGITWVQDITISSTATLVDVSSNLFFGRNTHPSYPEPLTSGSIIYINETYIKIDRDYWFNGAAFFYDPSVTPVFMGVIKELPTHKPNKYQVDLKLVSPLELLKDIEARDFSNKVTGETLTLDHTGDNNEEYYITANEGVGGITALYANGVKLYEGVDYNVSDLNDLALPAMIEVVNGSVFGQTFTADYYYWKRALAIEDIVRGLVALGGYDATTEDIQPVVWTSQVRNPPTISPVLASIGYYEDNADEYKFNLDNTLNNSWADARNDWTRQQIFCKNFDFSFKFTLENRPGSGSGGRDNYISFGDELGTGYGVKNGFAVVENLYYLTINPSAGRIRHRIYKISNNTPTLIYELEERLEEIIDGVVVDNTIKDYKIEQRNGTVTIYQNGSLFATVTSAETNLNFIVVKRDSGNIRIENQTWNFYDDNLTLVGANLSRPCIITETLDKTLAGITWGAIQADLGELDGQTYFLTAYFSDDGTNWDAGQSYNLDTDTAHSERYLYYVLGISNAPGMSFDITDPSTYFYATNLVLNMVNLGSRSVLEALQDLSLISGYEFGVDRNGVFFFRPRTNSTTPIYELDHSELVSVENVKKNLNDFFTKLTLTFSQIPLEFYANDGTRPTAIDKYGVINKDIDKPDIVNYDNPELAQAIGPQLLAIYSTARDNIQAVGKLNLALELGDIVNLKRNYPLTADPEKSDYNKFVRQDTYYRACKITGLNYNFDKRQITYTLRDVSNENNAPSEQDNLAYIYENPVELG